MIFKNRQEAGKLLAEKLKDYKKNKPIVLAIPRGGVVIGAEIANALHAELEVIIFKKIGAPENAELAIGSLCQDGSVFLNKEYVQQQGISSTYLKEEKERLIKEIEERKRKYKIRALSLKGKIVILVDDGMATGTTMVAALHYVQKQHPKKIIVAVPVSSEEAMELLRKEVDVICLTQPPFLMAIGEYYNEFEQVEDEEVVNILKQYRLKANNI